MKVEVLFDPTDAQPSWVVCSCNICVRFNNETAANTYSQKLERRLNAPHTWPGRHAQSPMQTSLTAREMQPRAV
jgi:hypothetical protein